MDTGTAGGIVGGMLGVMDGLIGAYFSIKNTSRPRERSLMIRMVGLCWICIVAPAALLFLTPHPED